MNRQSAATHWNWIIMSSWPSFSSMYVSARFGVTHGGFRQGEAVIMIQHVVLEFIQVFVDAGAMVVAGGIPLQVGIR